ncbi:fungal specific transcription factor-containing protein [Glarea lozoyensis ATCC 20868]|uniref:Fungal specific transcription factor-containing protein n=1 Tax=Glarea lozoyensis (strain ATCC 20868 / MF5171) TaxID=1116229 RepID=S3DF29_GLAL2|nr:fungal specific transcription factor-containing protein [Glarea lozoyensis ATCC 20868]EPE37022.1 fungal specific transcription factor-containing protein [Glarea lozoyensis ATCC 20868]
MSGRIFHEIPAKHTLSSPDQTTVNFLDFPFDTYTSEMSVDQIENMLPNPIQNGTQMIYPETMLVNSIPTSLHQTMPELSNGLVQRLHDICFDIYRPMMGMVDQIRFETELSHPTPTIQVQALSYAIAALGALSVPELHCHVSNCYQQSRNLLDLCEREETGESLSNINTLQACTLLTIYELKQPNFRRAWMSLGRTTRLAQMMGLGQSDGRPASVMTPQWSGPSPTPSLHNPVKTEEMRRTFWVLYILDGFASIITQSGVAFDQEINIPLPGRDVTIQEVVNNTDVTMPSLNVIFDPDVAGRVQISSLAGVVIMTHLYQRIVNHMNSSHNASHNFWEVHYDINKSIELCRNTLMVEHLTNNSDDPVAVALRMSMNTVDIMLHESALLRVHKEVLPVFLANDAISRCTTAVKDIIDALQMGQLLPGRKLESFQQLNNFHTWPITSAIQTCCRFLQMRCDNMSLYIYAIRVLSTSPTTKALVDENLIYGGLIEKANAMATEAEKSIPAS